MKKQNTKIKVKSLKQYFKEQYPTKSARQKADENFSRISLGYAIYQARRERGLTQTGLAKKLSTTQSEVARIEGGDQNVTTDKLNQIAIALNGKLKISLNLK